jgi:imidazolonepropionase-like amidohydrolase
MRALGLAKEFALDPVIVGGREAHATATELADAHASVIVSLNYPQRSRALAPDADEPLRDIEARAEAPAAAASLARHANVRFAFASAGLTEPNDFRRNLAKAVAAGLPGDAAIRALTLDAARLAGVGDRLGSLEPRKLATIIVAAGSVLDEKTVIRHVFVGGHQLPIERRNP